MSQVINTYGFDFDGATRISAYTSAVINLTDCNINFDIQASINDPSKYILHSDGVDTIYIGYQPDGDIYFQIVLDDGNSSFIRSDGTILTDKNHNINIKFESVVFGVSFKFTLSIDGVYMSEYTFTSQKTELLLFESSNSTFGAIYLGSYQYYSQSTLSNFTVISSGEKVFEETFNNTTKGTITGTEQYTIIGTEIIPDVFENYIYSKELVVDGLYTLPLELVNGASQPLVNINRSCLYSKNVIKVNFIGRVYFNLYRGYFDTNNNLQYDISNHQLITGTGEEQTLIFRDYTEVKQNYIAYYFELEAIENVSITVLEMGLIFDDFKGSKDYTTSTTTAFQKDINQNALSQQEYDKYVKVTNIVNKAQIQEFINVLERPFNYIHKDGCVDIETKALGNTNITVEYANGANQWMNATTTNIEEV